MTGLRPVEPRIAGKASVRCNTTAEQLLSVMPLPHKAEPVDLGLRSVCQSWARCRQHGFPLLKPLATEILYEGAMPSISLLCSSKIADNSKPGSAE
jgi:hypothetical protein